MTRQEAIKILEHLKPSNQVYNANDAYAVGQALCMAINSLETDEAYQLEYKEPTTKNDLGVYCISRDDVWDVMQELWGTSGELIDRLMSLPSVTPQESRKGKWIDTNDKGFEYHRIYKCSNCEYTVCAYPEEIKRYKFCYGCGSRNEVEE